MYNFTTEFWKTAGNTASVPVTATDQPALKQIQHHGLLRVSHKDCGKT